MARSIVLVTLVATSLATSLARGQAPETGYELALSGPSRVRAEREASYRGIAYRVRGIAELVPYSGRVRVRFRTAREEGGWIDLRSDAAGRFEVAISIGALSDAAARIEVEVGPEEASRSFEFPISILPAWRSALRTDRVLYEPGEPVHVWLLARDLASGAPAANRSVRVAIDPPFTERTAELTTSAAGVAYMRLDVPASAEEGAVTVRAWIDGAPSVTMFQIGQRTWERMHAAIEISPEEVAPGGTSTVRVHVTTPDAAPIRDAGVRLEVSGGEPSSATTDAEGNVEITVRAPAYLSAETGYASVTAHVAHPAYGSVEAHGTMRLAVPLALEVELVPAHGALIPEIDDVLFVRLSDALGDPPPTGAEVEIVGPAIPGGRARGRSDANGIVEIAVRLPRGASSESDGETSAQTTLRVHVRGGPLPRTARISVPVHPAPAVAPSLARALIEPGDPIEVRLERRPSAARLPAIVELLDEASGQPIATTIVAPGASSAQLRAPRDRLGVLAVRARPIEADESLEGTGALATMIVRPARPDFVSLVPARARWRVGETAIVDLHTLAGAPRAWAALLVRDLAAHGGEVDFHDYFLDRAFEQALLEASGEEGDRLVRAALAASTPLDGEPPIASPLLDALGLPQESSRAAESAYDRGALRDPWPLARELERRGIGGPMLDLENALAAALESGTLDEITVVRGGVRRFRDDLLEGHVTLGEGAMTPAMLEAVDPSFSFDAAARRVARVRLVRLLSALALYLDPGDEASIAARTAAREPWARWLQRMVERGVITDEQLDDPWGGRFMLRASRAPGIVLGANASGVELVSPGPDRRAGTADDVRDPFARVIAAGTPYAVASGEDALMRQLAVLSPAERTLAAIREAYLRISAEMTEDEIGDAVHASVSEGTLGLGGLGTSGHGHGGGGMGSGYGSGAGSMGSSARLRGMGASRSGNLARLVRERFPPTILFRPEIAIDSGGTTRLEIPLADAVTSYRIEVIVWREDGWIWSARTEISSDRDVVIDAPIPEVARLGDRLSLPLRVQNRTDAPRELEVQLLGDARVGISATEPMRVTVPAGDAVEVPVVLAPSAHGAGSLQVVARDPSGAPLDAVRRPITVVAPARRVRASAEALIEGRGDLALEIDAGADPRDGTIAIALGPALFDAPSDPAWSAWSGDRAIPSDPFHEVPAIGSSVALAFGIGAAWIGEGIEDERVRIATEHLARALDAGRAVQEPRATEARGWALLGLAPVTRDLERRPALGALMRQLLDRLAREVGDGAVVLDDAPEVLALSAAALAWSAADRSSARVAELIRRLERSIVEVGEDVWVASPSRPMRATILLAMAHAGTGDRARAFELLATVARWSRLGHTLEVDELGLARAAARRIAEGAAGTHAEAPSHVSITIDGAPRDVPMIAGRGAIEAPELAVAGAHVIRVEGDALTPMWIAASARYGVPWDVAPSRPGPFALAIEGVAGARDDVASLELVVSNRSPRWITTPIVELELPTGSELPESEHRRIRALVRASERGAGVLTLTLRPLAPGREVRIPLPLRWTVAGALRGFGIAAHAADRPDAITVLAPRDIAVAAERSAR